MRCGSWESVYGRGCVILRQRSRECSLVKSVPVGQGYQRTDRKVLVGRETDEGWRRDRVEIGMGTRTCCPGSVGSAGASRGWGVWVCMQ